MRKSIALTLLAVLLTLVASGCGKRAIEAEQGSKPVVTNPGNSNTTTPGNSNTTPEAPKESFFAPPPTPTFEKVNLGPLKLTEPAKAGPLTVTVDEKVVINKAAGLPPNYVHLVMKITVKNEGKDDYTINTTEHFKMETPEGKTMLVNIQATAQRSPRLQGTLQSGQTQTGWLGYLIKNQPGNFKYKFTHPDYGDAYWEFGL